MRKPHSGSARLILLGTLAFFVVLMTLWHRRSHADNELVLDAPPHMIELDAGRWSDFLHKMQEAKPASESLFVPDGYIKLRVETLNDTTTRLDNLQISEADFHKSRQSHKNVLELIPSYTDLVRYVPHSRGIVTVAGGSYSQMLIVSLRMLRRTKCRLPVEVFIPESNTQGQNEFDPYTCNVVLKELNARCVKLPKLEGLDIERYAYKSVALLSSTFEEALFIDADIFPLLDPAKFFDTNAFTSTGLLTWPDFWAQTTSPVFYALVEQPAPSIHEHASTEAGAMVISRKKHATTLLLAFYYNIFGPGFFYEMLAQRGIGGEGDKETWLAAARVLKQPYYQVRERNHGLVWGDDETDLDEITAMVQMDPVEDFYLSSLEPANNRTTWRNRKDSKIVFVHTNRVKLNPSRLLQRLDEFHGQRRIWGPKSKTVGIFGHDLEAILWSETIHVACYQGKVLLDTDNARQVCEDLRRFWWRVEMEEALEVRLKKKMDEDQRLLDKETKDHK